jgi:hypothetical protein
MIFGMVVKVEKFVDIIVSLFIKIRSGDTYNPDGAYKQKTVIAITKFTSKPLLMGPPHFSPSSYHHQSASAQSAAALFLEPPS